MTNVACEAALARGRVVPSQHQATRVSPAVRGKDAATRTIDT